MKLTTGHAVLLLGLFVSGLALPALADDGKGIGPIKDVTISPVDTTMANKGHKLFTTKCSACHKIEERYVGPALGGVTTRRKPEWIMNMILNPTQMTQEDETAKDLLGQFMVQMTFQNVSQDEARAILEYFRSRDAKPETAKKH